MDQQTFIPSEFTTGSSESKRHASQEQQTEDSVKSLVKNRINRCKICRKRFRNYDQFLIHVRLHTAGSKRRAYHVHQGQNQRIFLCHFCDTNFLGVKALLDHQHTEGACKLNLKKRRERIHLDGYKKRKLNKANSRPLSAAATTPSSSLLQTSSFTQQHEQHSDVLSSPQMSVGSSFIEVQRAVSMLQNPNPIQVPSNVLSSTDSILTVESSQYQQQNKQQESKENMVFRSISKQPNEGEVCNDDALQIEIPSHVKAIYLNNSNTNYDDVMKQLEVVNSKLDVIMKHLENNSIASGVGGAAAAAAADNRSETLVTSAANDTIEVQVSDAQSVGSETVIIEGFPPSYSMIQAAKEQQQQEYYALTLSSKQAQQLLKSETQQILAANVNDLKNFQQKGKTIDLCQYISQLTGYSEQQLQQQSEQQQEQQKDQQQESHRQHCEDQGSTHDVNVGESTINSIPNHIIDKVFVESRSRANFAKNLTFAIFSAEERRGKNCTGRVFGKAQHKGQLDQIKLQAVKEATFRKYPCNSLLVDITWKKECITAIDSGLRNENRNNRSHNSLNQQQPLKNNESTKAKPEEKSL